jgi:serine acetyltransferase
MLALLAAGPGPATAGGREKPVVLQMTLDGPNVTILKGVNIGAGYQAGSLITRDVPPGLASRQPGANHRPKHER